MATPQPYSRQIDTCLDLDGCDREGAIKIVNQAFDAAEEQGYTNVRCDYEYGYDGESGTMYVKGDKMETMEQAILREAQVQQIRLWTEKRERLEFERLAKKFGS